MLLLGGKCIEHISRMEKPALSSIPPEAAGQIAKQLSSCIAEYRSLWRKRSRRGGLQDSVNRLTRTLGELSDRKL